MLLGFPIRIGIVGGRISNTIPLNIRIIRIVRISGQFDVIFRLLTIFSNRHPRRNFIPIPRVMYFFGKNKIHTLGVPYFHEFFRKTWSNSRHFDAIF